MSRELQKILKDAIITTTSARPNYYVKVEFATLKQAQELGEYLAGEWHKAVKSQGGRRA